MRKRETKVERSCGCDGTILSETRMQANLGPMTHSHPCACVGHCTTQMNEKENVPATSQNNSGCEVLQRVYRSAGRSHVLKMRKCVHTTRRLQWIVINCKRNLQQRQRTLYQKKCRCTSFKSSRTLKSGGHLFSRT